MWTTQVSRLTKMMHFLITIFMLWASACCAKRAIFLLGDSVSQRLFKDGLVPMFNCTEVDPNIVFTCETTDQYRQDKGRICTGLDVSRVGYLIHFGVFESNYHNNWPSHQPYGGTNNSRTNILNAVAEFQHRTNGTEESVLFMFHSGVWDHSRYEQHKQLYNGTEDFLNHFQDAYTSLMLEIRQRLRKQDELVIATMHEVIVYDVHPMNERAKRVARHLRIPVFDQARILGPNITYLADQHHQKPAASVMLAKKILENDFSLIPEQSIGR